MFFFTIKVYEFWCYFLNCMNIGKSRDVPDAPRRTSVDTYAITHAYSRTHARKHAHKRAHTHEHGHIQIYLSLPYLHHLIVSKLVGTTPRKNRGLTCRLRFCHISKNQIASFKELCRESKCNSNVRKQLRQSKQFKNAPFIRLYFCFASIYFIPNVSTRILLRGDLLGLHINDFIFLPRFLLLLLFLFPLLFFEYHWPPFLHSWLPFCQFHALMVQRSSTPMRSNGKVDGR